jgi:hypothetical protein
MDTVLIPQVLSPGLLIIRNGNLAEHAGNGVADAAMFKAFLVNEDSDFANTFEALYHCNPEDYLEHNEITMLRRMLDCEASIATIHKNNKGASSFGLRDEHSSFLDELYEAQDASGSIIKWEANNKNKVQVERLEEITAEIVRLDRMRRPSSKVEDGVSDLFCQSIWKPLTSEADEDFFYRAGTGWGQ